MKDPKLRDDLPPAPGRWLPLQAALLGVLGLFVVYLILFFTVGAPAGRIGPLAYVPAALYLAGAIVAVVLPKSRRLGSGMLLGLGIWLIIGGGVCIAGLAGTGGSIA